MSRSRWVAVGAVCAVLVGSGGLLTASASVGSGERPVYIAITPCRVMDTRTSPDNVGPRATPIGGNETYTIVVHGTNGNCSIPSDAVAVVMNVVAVAPTADSFLTVFPAGQTRPLAASLNFIARQAPTPNAVTSKLAPDGRISFYNLAGNVHLVVDINGYFVDHNHDDRYYTKTEIDQKLPDASPVSGRCSVTLRWDLATCRKASVALPAGASWPLGLVFDGTYLWTANLTPNLTRFDLATHVGTNFALPAGAGDTRDITFDGTYLWVVGVAGDPGLSRIDPVTGAGTHFPLPAGAHNPVAVASDGTHIWTANIDIWTTGIQNVTRVDPATGAGTNFTLPEGAITPFDLVFDGIHVWTINPVSDNVTRIDPATGVSTNFALPPGADHPIAAAFDGTYLWTTNSDSDNVTRIDPGTGSGTNFALPAGADRPGGVAFDGFDVWIGNQSANVTRLDPATGAGTNVALPSGSVAASKVAFDGDNIWTASANSNTLSKLVP